MIAMLAQAPDYGDYYALLDGQPTNLDTRQPATSEIPFPGPEIFYNYLPEVYVAKDRALGMFQLTKGRHALTFVCNGKDPRSAGYNFGIQELVLEKVQQTPTPTAEEARVPKPALPADTPIYRGRPLVFYLTRLKTAPRGERADLLRAVGSFGPGAVPAVDALISALSDSDAETRGAAANALAQIGPACSESFVRLFAARPLPGDSCAQVHRRKSCASRSGVDERSQ